MLRKSSSCQEYKYSASSETSTSSSSSEDSSDKPLKRFNRLLRQSVARHWGYFRKQRFGLAVRGRSVSDAGLCSIVDNDPDPDLAYLDISSVPVRHSLKAYAHSPMRSTVPIVPSMLITSSAGAGGADEASDSDAERLKKHHLRVPTPAFVGQSTGNFAAGAAGGGCGAPRSAPATPLQLEPHPRKHDKHVVKPLSGSEPSVQAAVLGSGSDTAEGKQPSKSRQKKFQRHFPQVGPEERVLNYYSCALVGDLLLQGHLYITKNYFAFYSNVFGYVTKLLIPTNSVLRITKEKVARIIPNAIGVCTRDERHVFGSLLSRDSTYKLMTHVWKAARMPEALPIKPQELRASEVELDASEYSPEDDSSCSGGPDTTAANRRESEAIIAAAGAAIIQPALLTGSPRPPPRADWLLLLLVLAAAVLTLTAGGLAYTLYSREEHQDLEKMTSSELYSEIVRWRANLHTRAASELHSFLTTNLLLLTKVRQSLEALSGVILTDLDQNASGTVKLDLPNETAFS